MNFLIRNATNIQSNDEVHTKSINIPRTAGDKYGKVFLKNKGTQYGMVRSSNIFEISKLLPVFNLSGNVSEGIIIYIDQTEPINQDIKFSH